MQVERVVPVRKQVPFLDLELSHAELKRTVLAEFADVIDAGAFVNGPQVAAFEQAFATYCGVRFCVGLSSGLDALRLALLGAGIEPGDEVVVPAMTFVATLEAVTQASGRPVLADISEADYCIDPGSVDAAAGPRARFLVPVHLYGQMADTHSLVAIAQARALLVIEDACQAHGVHVQGRLGLLLRSASIRPRTWVRSGTPARWSRAMRTWLGEFARCVSTANGRNIGTRLRVTRRGLTPFRRSFYATSSRS
jgi:dTDP-4-amino-4,6-dideoxygalactose transaminase